MLNWCSGCSESEESSERSRSGWKEGLSRSLGVYILPAWFTDDADLPLLHLRRGMLRTHVTCHSQTLSSFRAGLIGVRISAFLRQTVTRQCEGSAVKPCHKQLHKQKQEQDFDMLQQYTDHGSFLTSRQYPYEDHKLSVAFIYCRLVLPHADTGGGLGISQIPTYSASPAGEEIENQKLAVHLSILNWLQARARFSVLQSSPSSLSRPTEADETDTLVSWSS